MPIVPAVRQAIEDYVRQCPYPLNGDAPLFVGARGGPLNATTTVVFEAVQTIFERLQVALDGRLAYFFLTQEMMDECGVISKDTEDLIDIVRGLRGVDVVCRIQEVSDGVRFSFRSQNPKYPIIGLAQRFGGGGHAMAAGASGEGMSLEEAETLLVQYTEELLRG